MKSDIEIAQECRPQPITDVAKELGLFPQDLILYGKYKAKVPINNLERLSDMPDGRQHLWLCGPIAVTE